MQNTKSLILIAVSIFSINSYETISAAPMSRSSKLKVATGTLVSSAIGGCLAALLTHYGNVDASYDFHHGWFGLSLKFWDLNRTFVCSIATLAAALIGGGVSYYCFTPEGKLSRASDAVKSIDRDLLKFIEDSQNFEQFSKKIQFYFKASSFSSIAALEYLEEKHSTLIAAKEILDELLKKIATFTQLESEIVDLRTSIDTMMPIIEKGVTIIRSDSSFDIKWQAYMLEKRLAAIQTELTFIRMKS